MPNDAHVRNGSKADTATPARPWPLRGAIARREAVAPCPDEAVVDRACGLGDGLGAVGAAAREQGDRDAAAVGQGFVFKKLVYLGKIISL